jgi:hypothetical protein
MRSKGQASVRVGGKPIVHNSVEYEGDQPSQSLSVIEALRTNIQDSLDELDMMRGTLQYWESRRPASDPKERALLMEAFRVMHGELLGLTARTKELLERMEQAKKG